MLGKLKWFYFLKVKCIGIIRIKKLYIYFLKLRFNLYLENLFFVMDSFVELIKIYDYL